MLNESNIFKMSSVIEWAGGAFRIVSGLLVAVTIHYIGFFANFTNDYFLVMSATLIKRVGWELFSTLAYTSLMGTVFFLIGGVLKAAVVGMARVSNAEFKFDIEKLHGNNDPSYIILLFLISLTFLYNPYEVSLTTKTFIVMSSAIMMGFIYLVFFKEFEESTRWSRFVYPLRHKELGVRALIAAVLLVSYFTGKGLALSLQDANPMQIITENGELSAVVLDITDNALLIKNEDGLVLLPMHVVKKVVLSKSSSDTITATEPMQKLAIEKAK